ncbi:ABC transporter, sulfonate/nitrate/taurine transport, transmembrane [Galdieria sulphuraria]|uniref:ABC transporter, sulfonate/nitrate/taurine transport, transmembrane n=1 Tax=Galdieria sulphuraria TaxID=130081 RepID=M2XYQ7_GALSU|nr:ABC transporter, sulfonate/nitrate/taurine transport, transmembrane [Galdieria sulphuraria]EME28793.1 ABC transporter, sulfonate/nitrate/taurine transport, transmembrane [Galdieria sulphuraria]|eukprot:XP_005705313.1 ABC transporter, sulfonate/nitrate/taurine transport, transmembrane [Galdieria sulphuraria]
MHLSCEVVLFGFVCSVHRCHVGSLTHSFRTSPFVARPQRSFIEGIRICQRRSRRIFRKIARIEHSVLYMSSETDLYGHDRRKNKSHVRSKPFATHSTAEDGFVLEEEEECVEDAESSSSSRLPGWSLPLFIIYVSHSLCAYAVLLLDRPVRIDQKRRFSWNDFFLVLVLIAVVYAVVSTFSHVFTGISPSELAISTNPKSLPWQVFLFCTLLSLGFTYLLNRYALQSTLRISLAYIVSLLFALVYAYLAYKVEFAAQFLLLVLDILQSIPLLSFLPGVVLGIIYIFPGQRIGEEIAAILLLFTSMAWNIVFCFYQSLCGIPKDLNEAAEIFRLNPWKRFWLLELPSGAISLVWNSIISVAGGWFFLISIESFILGNQDFRIPGLGSFLAVAANEGNFRSIWFGLATIILVIVVLNYLIWWPLIAWTEKFSYSYQRNAEISRSSVLNFLQRSSLLRSFHDRFFVPFWDWFVNLQLKQVGTEPYMSSNVVEVDRWKRNLLKVIPSLFIGAFWIFTIIGVYAASNVLRSLNLLIWKKLFVASLLTCARVVAALALSLVITVPVGVMIGRNQRLSAYLQPIVQIAASVPATALFPFLVLALTRIGGGLEMGSIALMMLGTMWYILFNVIAGAQAIPFEFFEVDQIYGKGDRFLRWRTLILPGIFPYLITGIVTAVGGAWNASIVSEYVNFQGTLVKTEVQ